MPAGAMHFHYMSRIPSRLQHLMSLLSLQLESCWAPIMAIPSANGASIQIWPHCLYAPNIFKGFFQRNARPDRTALQACARLPMRDSSSLFLHTFLTLNPASRTLRLSNLFPGRWTCNALVYISSPTSRPFLSYISIIADTLFLYSSLFSLLIVKKSLI